MDNRSDFTVLVDAYSQIFRAYYAIRQPMTNQRGEPVNALYVFARLLLQLEKSFPCSQGAMLFDCGRVDFRLKLEPLYKANRPPMPDDLRRQIGGIKELTALFGWPQLQFENYEADDLIGGFALAIENSPVRIVSSDKDLSQLITPQIKMAIPLKNGFEERGVAEVVEKFGVLPELIADYLALVGDSADNIQGVAGIGPKTAAELLNTFGGIDCWIDTPQVWQNSKFAKKLSGQQELLRRNQKLVRLRTDLPEPFGVLDEVLKRQPVNWHGVREFFQNQNFHSLLKELPLPVETPEIFAESSLFTDNSPAPATEEAEFIQDELF